MSAVQGVFLPVERRSAVRALSIAALCIVAVLAMHWQTSLSLVSIWMRSDTFAHGMLVVPATLFLMWVHRRELSGVTMTTSPPALAALAAATAVWVLGTIADLLVVQQFALVAMVQILAWLILGREFVGRMAFPLGFLVFAVPFGERLIPHLMEFTAGFTVVALELTGIPVYREGLYFSIPSGDFEVAKACSGIRYLIGSVSLGCLYAYLMYRSFRRRLVFIVISAVVPVLANGVRAYLIVLVAHLSDMKLAVGIDHLVYGWLFFGLVMFLLFWIGRYFREDEPLAEGARPGWDPAPVGPGLGRMLAVAAPGLAIVAFGPLFFSYVDAAAESSSAGYAPQLPAAVGDWQGPLPAPDGWRPQFAGAQTELGGTYRLGDRVVTVHLVGYQRQAQGAELINAGNRLFDPDVWRVSADGRRTLDGSGRTVRELVLRSGPGTVRVWYWFRAGGRSTVSDVAVKWSEISEVLAGRADSAALLAVAADDGSDDGAADLLAAFVAMHDERLAACADSGVGEGCAR